MMAVGTLVDALDQTAGAVVMDAPSGCWQGELHTQAELGPCSLLIMSVYKLGHFVRAGTYFRRLPFRDASNRVKLEL
jgi:hypothetical protein